MVRDTRSKRAIAIDRALRAKTVYSDSDSWTGKKNRSDLMGWDTPPTSRRTTKRPSKSRSGSSILSQFKQASKDVWQTPSVEKMDIKVKVRESGPLMSLGYSGRVKPVAIGSSLLRYPREATLYVSQKAKKLPEKQFKSLLKHEAIHIGYPRHDVGFREVAKERGIPMSYSMAEGGGYRVQVKRGSRFETLKEFGSLPEAQQYGRSIVGKYGKVRLSY